MSTLSGKTTIITGASSGLGRALALDLSGQEMNLVLAARNVAALRQVAEEAERSNSTVLVQPTDVTEADQCRILIDKAVEQFQSIDFLILNAGISMWARFDEITDPSLLQKLMETNYFGAINCIHPALPHLKRSGGTIVAVSSLQAVLGVPHHTGYAASKHALKGFLESLELELNNQVHILNVMPGWISGTNLRANALVGDGSQSGSPRRHSKHAVSLARCSERIVRAMRQGRGEIYIPTKLGYLAPLKRLAPKLVKKLITRAVDKQVRPESQGQEPK